MKLKTRISNRLGTFMREQRIDLSLRLIDVAKVAELTPNYISKIELGHIPDGPSLAAIKRIAGAIGVKEEVLIRLNKADITSPTGEVAELPIQDLSTDETEFLLIFRKSNKDLQQILLTQVKLLHQLASGKLTTKE